MSVLMKKATSIPPITPMFNVGCLMDIPTGSYIRGSRGEWVLNGGVGAIISIAGPPNSCKSLVADYINLTLAENIKPYTSLKYDTENSGTYSRLQSLAARYPKMSQMEHGDEFMDDADRKFMITSAAEVMGDEFFELVKDSATEIVKDKNRVTFTTPMSNSRGDPITMYNPLNSTIDSISMLAASAVQESMEKNNIGDSTNNTVWLRDGGAKRQLITQLPNITSKSGIRMLMVAHVGDEFDLGGKFVAKPQKMTHAKKGSKITGATKMFEFINNVLWEITNASVLNNEAKDTGVKYPLTPADRMPNCVDLLKITMKIVRNKSGASGPSITLIVSQREGVLPHLSNFHYIKGAEKKDGNSFGVSGSNVSYFLDLLPEVKLQRTTVRGLIDSNAKLRRALEITSDMKQMTELWEPLPDGLMCTPKELYDDLIKLGYDWDMLLSTRGWWCYLEHEKDEAKPLSTMDLLDLRKGNKVFWMVEDGQ